MDTPGFWLALIVGFGLGAVAGLAMARAIWARIVDGLEPRIIEKPVLPVVTEETARMVVDEAFYVHRDVRAIADDIQRLSKRLDKITGPMPLDEPHDHR